MASMEGYVLSSAGAIVIDPRNVHTLVYQRLKREIKMGRSISKGKMKIIGDPDPSIIDPKNIGGMTISAIINTVNTKRMATEISGIFHAIKRPAGGKSTTDKAYDL